MAPLNFNVHGYRFQESVKSLQRSFTLAIEAAHGEHARALADAEDYQQHIKRGGRWIGEVDPDGFIVWDNAQVLLLRESDALSALENIRKAFVIALYHQWERSIREWTGAGPHAKHETLVTELEAKGVHAHPKLSYLRVLVNALKHNNEAWGLNLYSNWPEVLPYRFQPDVDTSWYDMVQLSDQNLVEAFNIVANSGPTRASP